MLNLGFSFEAIQVAYLNSSDTNVSRLNMIRALGVRSHRVMQCASLEEFWRYFYDESDEAKFSETDPDNVTIL